MREIRSISPVPTLISKKAGSFPDSWLPLSFPRSGHRFLRWRPGIFPRWIPARGKQVRCTHAAPCRYPHGQGRVGDNGEGDREPEHIHTGNGAPVIPDIVPDTPAVDNNPHLIQAGRDTGERHAPAKRHAEIYRKRPDTGIRIKGLIGRMDLPAAAAAEPLNPYGDHLLLFPIHDNGKLSLFNIIPGKISPTGRAGIAGIKQYVIIRCQCSLDNVGEHRRDAAFSHGDAPVPGVPVGSPGLFGQLRAGLSIHSTA